MLEQEAAASTRGGRCKMMEELPNSLLNMCRQGRVDMRIS